MTRRFRLRTISWLAAALATASVAVPSPLAAGQARVAHSKPEAERNLLRVASQSWRRARITGLIDRDTGLPKNNVQAVCRGRGQSFSPSRYRRFVCVMRVGPGGAAHRRYVAYRALKHGYFRVRMLASRPR